MLKRDKKRVLIRPKSLLGGGYKVINCSGSGEWKIIKIMLILAKTRSRQEHDDNCQNEFIKSTLFILKLHSNKFTRQMVSRTTWRSFMKSRTGNGWSSLENDMLWDMKLHCRNEVAFVEAMQGELKWQNIHSKCFLLRLIIKCSQ